MRKNSLVSIQSVPRSGSSWLGQIFKSSPHVEFRFQPLFSYAFKDRLNGESTREEILRFFSDIRETNDSFVLQQDPAIHVEYPDLGERAAVTHLVMKEVRYNHIIRNMLALTPELKVIGLVRNPRAVIDSWIHAPREFKPEWNVEEQWRSGALKNQGRPEEFFGFEKWKEVAQLFVDLASEFPDRMKVLRYSDLNTEPDLVVREVFTFCGLPFGPETKRFIALSRSRQGHDANSVFRTARPDIAWKERLPKHIAAEMESELAGGPLQRFL